MIGVILRGFSKQTCISLVTLLFLASCSDTFNGGLEFSNSQSSKKNNGSSNPNDQDQLESEWNQGENEVQKFGSGDSAPEGPVDYSVFSGSGSACAVIENGGSISESTLVGDLYRTNVYHKTAAVDPGNTGNDPSVGNFGFPAVAAEASSTLNVSEFSLSKESIGYLSYQGIDEIEYVAFAHQFASGLDRIKIELINGNANYSDISNTNIYSAYGYLNLKNLRVEGERIFADLEIFSFNYNPNLSGAPYNTIRSSLSGASPRDGTDIAVPASKGVAPKVSEKNIDITDAKVKITIDAVNYDSFQFRAIRGTIWSKMPVPCN